MSRILHQWSSSSRNALADEAFDEAVRALAAHRPDGTLALARALAVDPRHVGALALKGFANLLLARQESTLAAGACLQAARAALSAGEGGAADERVLVEALDAACAGGFGAAARILDNGFADRPAELLPFKLAHGLRFLIGDATGMLASSRRMLSAWRPELPGAGFLLGCHAFALEEKGFFAEAERIGRTAVAIEPADAWGLHAVSHVYETRGETDLGVQWLEDSRPTWAQCNNFSFHVAWHLALLYMRRGGHDRALALYDAEIMPFESDDFRDLANAISLLWRLARDGVDVAARWHALAEAVHRRSADVTLVFATLHNLMALRALKDFPAIADLMAALTAKAQDSDEQGVVARDLGLPLARVLAGLSDDPAGARAEALRLSLHRLGGSNVQRDLFAQALMDEGQAGRVKAAANAPSAAAARKGVAAATGLSFSLA